MRTLAEQQAAMTERIVADALAQASLEHRLRAYVSDAIESAHGFANWWSGRLALSRLSPERRARPMSARINATRRTAP